MADDMAELAFMGIDKGVDNYEKAWDPMKNRTVSMKQRYQSRRSSRRGPDNFDDGPYPEREGYVLKKRSEVRSDEEIVDRARNQDVIPYRPKNRRRASSLDGDDYRGGRSDRRVGAYRGRDQASDSEGSVPPQNRRRRKSSRSSSKSSSDLGSSGEDVRKCKDLTRKTWLTAGLAAVATIHAAAKVYSSLEDRDKRVLQVNSGELSKEDARKKRNRARLQDAAALGVAAVGIRSAMSEWHEVEEKHEEAKKTRQEREERHAKRLERQKRQGGGGDGMLSPRKAITDYPENDRRRSKSTSAYDYDDRDSRDMTRTRSRN